MAGKYQRQTDNPNTGKRNVKNAFRQKQGGKSSKCISRMPDGKVYVFDPGKAARKSKSTTVVTVAKVAEVQRMASIVGYTGNVE